MSMSNKVSKKLLITQSVLCNYAGSEIVTLEMAEHATSLGFEVAIMTNYYGPPISYDFPEEVKVFGPDELLDVYDYSHVWIHHNLIPKSLIEAMLVPSASKTLPVVAFHHMSPYVPIESPLFPAIERNVADFIYFNSEESMDAHVSILGPNKTAVLGNPAPDSFLRTAPLGTEDLKKVLLVTNHSPNEVSEAIRILKARGIAVDHFGEGGRPVRITPEVIQNYNLIISIGKTVQYSLIADVPVYCYDHFGGPGYLDAENFAKAKYYNFSGRGFVKKNSKEIATDIITNFATARVGFHKLHKAHKNSFLLSKAMNDFFMSTSAHELRIKLPEDVLISTSKLIEVNHQLSRSLIHYRLEKENLEKKYSDLSRSNQKLNKEILELKNYVRNLPHNRIKRKIKRFRQAGERSDKT